MKKSVLFIFGVLAVALLGTQFSSCGSKDDDPCSKEESMTISKSGVINAVVPSISLSVKVDGGGFIADAACPANMEAIYEWAKSGNTEAPPLLLDFESEKKTFPSGTVEEISQGVYRNVVNEAEDVSSPGGTSYGVTVTIDTANWDAGPFPSVTVNLEIVYKKYNPDAYPN